MYVRSNNNVYVQSGAVQIVGAGGGDGGEREEYLRKSCTGCSAPRFKPFYPLCLTIMVPPFHIPRINPRGGTPLYGLYRYVRPQRVWFSAVLVINRVSIIAILPPLWS